MNRKQFMKAMTAVAFSAAGGASAAQTVAPIRILVGFPAGGAPDTIARQFAEQLRKASGDEVVVENRTGATGKIAIDALLAAPADGRTVAVIPSSVLILAPMVMKSATYDVTRDFVAMGDLAEYGFGIAAGPASHTHDLKGFLEWARSHPKDATFATPGMGTPQHFLGAELAKAAGVPLLHVPYRGGAPALTDVLGGQVPALITTEPLLVPFHRKGKLSTLVVTSPERNPKLPEVPTAREAGLPQLETRDWFGLFAKSGTAAGIVAKWRSRIGTVLQADGYRKAIGDLGYAIPKSQPSDFAPRLDTERGAWSERVKTSGFTATD